jgi:dCTP deaminase
MTHGILTGREIAKQRSEGRINIDPWDDDRINPASYDLSLGGEVKVYKNAVFPETSPDLNNLTPRWCVTSFLKQSALDAAKDNEVHSFQLNEGDGFLIFPGIGYLMHTRERVFTEHYVPIIDGKSSIGRLFVKVHETAGYGDPGFDGQYTLEVTTMQPIHLYVGMRICQVRFHTVVGEVASYQDHKSNYTGTSALGAVASRAWQMFVEGDR